MTMYYTSLSLKQKLNILSLLPATILALVFILGILFTYINEHKHWLTQQSQALTCITAENISAAVLFNDTNSAEKTLSVLQVESSILFAQVKSNEGSFNASYQSKSNPKINTINLNEQNNLIANLLPSTIMTRCPVIVDNKSIAILSVVTDSQILIKSLKNFIVTALIAMILSIWLISKMTERIHDSIAQPILYLKGIMQRVATEHQYHIRVPEHSHKDIEDLYHGFNHMLEQVQKRDDEINQQKQSLQLMIKERSEQLSKMNEKRILWLENMSFFLHHELKNKIIGFQSTLDLIERKFESNAIETYIERARKSTSFMNQLLANVGDASDLEAAIWTEQHEILNLSILVQEQIDEYHSNYHQHHFLSNISKNLQIVGNPIRLIQMLDKLISNAVEHAANKSDIKINLTQNGQHAVLEICNEGDALPDDTDSIFNLFISSKKKVTGNYGIGLYLVKLISDSHNGDIEASPLKEGQGASFKISIPCLIRHEL